MADTRQRQPPVRLSEVEAADIIREATTRSLTGRDADRTLSREDLLTMAREMGLSESAVEGVLAARARKQQRQHRRRKALVGLAWHGASYAIVIGGLTLMDVLGGPAWWVQWPAIGWGIGLAFHAAAMLVPANHQEARDRQ